MRNFIKHYLFKAKEEVIPLQHKQSFLIPVNEPIYSSIDKAHEEVSLSVQNLIKFYEKD